jgi:hypothetical protein
MVVPIKVNDNKDGKAKATFDRGLYIVDKLPGKPAVRLPL